MDNVHFACQVPKIRGTKSPSDTAIQEAQHGTFPTARQAEFLDGHNCGGNKRVYKWTQISGKEILTFCDDTIKK